jgi:hypothetical protein
MATVLDVLTTHFFLPEETATMLQQASARIAAMVPKPVIEGPKSPVFARPTDTQPDRPIALTGRSSAFIEALCTPSPGYEPLLMAAGWGQVAARGIAKLAVRHGSRRADESKWQRRVFDAIRFLAQRKRQRRAILSRARHLLQADNESTIIRSIFGLTDIFEGEFMHLLKLVSEGQNVDYQRITDIAASIAPYLSPNRGPKVSAASAAHEFLLNPEIELSAARRPAPYQDQAAEYVAPLTAATRLEFGMPNFDPRPALRRVARQKANSSAK